MQGASAIESTLKDFPRAPLRVFVVWERVLLTDVAPPSTSVLSRVRDRRAAQFWDRGRVLSQKMLVSGFQNPLRGPVVWDIVALFGPGARWDESFPQPDFSGAAVVDAIDEVRRRLAHSYSKASTNEALTADSAGPIAAIKAAPRITGTSAAATGNGN